MADINSSNPKENANGIISIFREAVKNFPLLKYSWVLIATICILSLIGFYKLETYTVFSYAFVVLIISFLGFLLSSLNNTRDKFKRFLLNVLVTCLVLTTGVAILCFGTFIVWEEPEFYYRWFPKNSDKENRIVVKDSSKGDTTDYSNQKKEKTNIPNSSNDGSEPSSSVVHSTKSQTKKSPSKKEPNGKAPIIGLSTNIKGQLVDKKNQPLVGAKIYLYGRLVSETDPNGFFSIKEAVETDNIKFGVKFNNQAFTITVGRNQTDFKEIL